MLGPEGAVVRDPLDERLHPARLNPVVNTSPVAPGVYQAGDFQRGQVLRDGRLAASLPVAEASEEKIVSLMVGQVMGQQFPKFESETGKDVLRVENLVSGTALKGVSFSLRRPSLS